MLLNMLNHLQEPSCSRAGRGFPMILSGALHSELRREVASRHERFLSGCWEGALDSLHWVGVQRSVWHSAEGMDLLINQFIDNHKTFRYHLSVPEFWDCWLNFWTLWLLTDVCWRLSFQVKLKVVCFFLHLHILFFTFWLYYILFLMSKHLLPHDIMMK